MIPVIVMTHGYLARELVSTVQGIVGQVPDLVAVCLESHEGIEDLQHKLMAVLAQDRQDRNGYLLLVDMFGGTPSNVALVLAQQYPLQVITGVNLPMVLEAVLHRPLMTLNALADLVACKGCQSIMNANARMTAGGRGEDNPSCP